VAVGSGVDVGVLVGVGVAVSVGVAMTIPGSTVRRTEVSWTTGTGPTFWLLHAARKKNPRIRNRFLM
jgi:hypothetical protein